MRKHPHIVGVRAIDFYNGRLFIALEFVTPNGMGINSLDKYIVTKRIAPSLVLKWGIQVCQGMQHAAARGLIAHRDIKPSNLMVDPSGTVKITDFGLATFSLSPSLASVPADLTFWNACLHATRAIHCWIFG